MRHPRRDRPGPQDANKTGIAGIAMGSIGVLIGLIGVALRVLYGGMMASGAAGH